MGDIEIARSVTLKPIEEVAKKVGIQKEDLECYGKYKAKLSEELRDKVKNKENGKLIGVIDPMPIIGDPLYDLLFAIVSNKDILKNITLEKIYSLANEPKEKINAMLTIVLYSRIARCIKYQPQDIDTYLNYWNKFKI